MNIKDNIIKITFLKLKLCLYLKIPNLNPYLLNPPRYIFHISYILLFAVLFTITKNTKASETYINTNLSIAFFGTQAEFSDTLRIGPNADIEVVNEWLIASNYVFIDPNATIHGNGTMVFSEPSTFIIGGVAKNSNTVYVDGGNALIDVDVRVDNKLNVELINSNLYLGKRLILNIDDGHVILNNQDLVLDSNATISNYSENRYIVTNNNGELVKEHLTSFVYPIGATEGIGSNHDYTPSELVNTGSRDNIGTRVFLGVYEYATFGRPQTPNSVNRTWYISEDTIGGSNIKVTLQHNEKTEGIEYDTISPVNGAFVTRFTNSSPNNGGDTTSQTYWENMKRSSSSPDAMPGTLTTGTNLANGRMLDRSGFTQLGYFTKAVFLSHGRVLPVELISFDVKKEGLEVILNWQTASEINNSHFIIERSFDGVTFTNIGKVNGNGNSNQTINYQYIDPIESYPSGYVYYRLKQFDFNNTYEYSGIKFIKIEEIFLENELYFYPNPSKAKFTLKSKTQGTYKYQVINSIGKLVMEGNIMPNASIDLKEYAAGAYYIQLYKDQIKLKTISILLSN